MYYNYIKCKAICLGIEQLIKIRGKSLAKAPNRQLAVSPTIRRPCTDFLTGLSACLSACLPAYLPVHTCLYLLVYACLSVSVYGGIKGCLIWFGGKVGPIKGFDWFDWLIDCIDSNRSLWAFAGWLWLDSIDWLNHLWCSLASRSNGCRLVLVTVVWFWRRSSPTCLPACVCVWFNSGEGSARSKALIDSNRSLWPFAGCTFERWLSGVPP